MDSYEFFSVIRVVAVSIVHGITLSILVRGDRRSRRMVAASMVLLTLLISVFGIMIILITPSAFAHVSRTAFMMLIVMGLIFCFVSSGSSMTERLFVYIMYVAVFMLAVGYSSLVSTIFFRAHAQLATLVIRTVISIIMIILLKVSLRDRLYRLVDGLSVHGVEITMFSWLIGLSVLEYSILSYFFVDNLAVNACVLVLLTLMVISIFAIAHRIVQLTAREVEMEKAIGRQRLLESELEAEKVFVERARAIRHDQRHHDRMVLEYLDSGDIEKARRYLGAHDESVEAESLASWCSDPLVDAQIRIAWRSCASRGIAFRADIQLPDSLGVDGIDFVSVMGNLLENAIEAASGADSPSVSITSRTAKGKLLLEISNAFSGTFMPKEGIGLESVRRILSRCNGLLMQESRCGTFISRVIIPMKE